MENNRLKTRDLVYAYGDWIIRELFNGHNPYYINTMFDPLDCRTSTVITQMTDAIYAAKGSLYAKLCSRFDRHPGRKGRNRFVPHAFLFFVSRDYLDENGGGQSEFEAAAGSEVMIGLGPEVRKHFFWVSVFDCR